MSLQGMLARNLAKRRGQNRRALEQTSWRCGQCRETNRWHHDRRGLCAHCGAVNELVWSPLERAYVSAAIIVPKLAASETSAHPGDRT